MTSPEATQANHRLSFLGDFTVTWFTSIVVALIVLVIIALCSDFDIIRTMELLGQDEAVRSYALRDDPAKHLVVVVDIDNDTIKSWSEGGKTVGEMLPGLISLVRKRANTVVLDLELGETIADDPKKRLVAALKAEGARMVVPMRLRPDESGNGWKAEKGWIDALDLGGNTNRVTRAAGLLESDDFDGVVRHLTSGACVSFPMEPTSSEKKWMRVSSLAEAVVNPQPQIPCRANAWDEKSSVILYHDEKTDGPVRKVSAGALIDKTRGDVASELDHFAMTDAYVLIGQTGDESWTDRHKTPLGWMPGVLVTANAIFTEQKGIQKREDVGWLEVASILVLAAFYALLMALVNRLIPNDEEKNEDMTCVQRGWCVARFCLVIFALGSYFFVSTFIVGWIRRSMAASALADGVAFGTYVPVLAVGLETLLEAGESAIGSVRKAFEMLFARKGLVTLALAAILATHGCGHAEDTAGRLTLQFANADVLILRGEQQVRPAGELVLDLLPNDIVVVGASTDVRVDRKGHPAQLLHGPDRLLIDPAPRGGVLALWESFWRRPHEQRGPTYAPGLSIVSRGDQQARIDDPAAVIAAGGDIARALPVAGRLRLASAFADAEYLTTDRDGLALAWAGGTPPYRVQADDAGGATIAEFRAETTFLWRPDWRVPQGPMRVTIIDANARTVRLEVKGASAGPSKAAEDPLADAIDLFETKPAWRLEALRRIARLAGDDPTAAQAVLAVRLAE